MELDVQADSNKQTRCQLSDSKKTIFVNFKDAGEKKAWCEEVKGCMARIKQARQKARDRKRYLRGNTLGRGTADRAKMHSFLKSNLQYLQATSQSPSALAVRAGLS